MADEHRFTQPEIAAVYRAIHERRDMRHFRSDPVAPEVLERLLDAAHHAPSVGFMQPWRFIRITKPELRQQLHALVEVERLATAEALGKRGNEFMKLKVEGILNCGELLVVGLMEGREQHVFGRRTMPEMDLASASCAIQNLWLAARAEGLAVGWVSLFDPAALAQLLCMPSGSTPMAVLCIGHTDEFYEEPMLQTEGWRDRDPIERYLYEDKWES
ncbi:5,6-dimethylbenzimidazole synthase [Halioglobus maricola]|uniref:5,6-dimethylbenzimidazole synthase n=1 Tax=Halioglobus maricola TaxID=2601894 RepID=A0A5P9NJB1_9GAMM|nr:5,6-dimethylbenzimidazole synthase [Halioglobus maricola]QFU75645.1 5,6-dimethylbenzimidazole synthase [Halioglobus maricola]